MRRQDELVTKNMSGCLVQALIVRLLFIDFSGPPGAASEMSEILDFPLKVVDISTSVDHHVPSGSNAV